MSLFQAREWWRASCGSGEEFDQGCLCVGNIDNASDGRVKIVTASFQGQLRVFMPQGRSFRPEDLLLEVDLQHPVIQIECGRFSSHGGLHLAVLQPRMLAVYNFEAVGTSYLQMSLKYHHTLEHTAANMTFGPFGGVKDVDSICVQSYDGQLAFFDQETPGFSRFLPSFLIPGPLSYVASSDSLVTCTASFELESYRYRALAAASGEKTITAQGSSGLQPSASKKVQSDWRLVLGEAAVAITVGRISRSTEAGQESSDDIIVLGEHTIFCVSARGQLVMQRRLEYHPACCTAYPSSAIRQPTGQQGGPLENLLVSTHTRALLVYKEGLLVWAAKTETQPVALKVAMFGSLPGLIVSLDDCGTLVVQYMGTDPPNNVVNVVENKDLNYADMDAEHRQLLAKIRSSTKPNILQEPADKVLVRAQVSPTLMSDNEFSVGLTAASSSVAQQLLVRIFLTYTGPMVLEGVSVTITPPRGTLVDEDTLFLHALAPGEEELLEVFFSVDEGNEEEGPAQDRVPSSTTAHLIVSYEGAGGQPRASYLEVALPLALFCRAVGPVKNASYKITVDTNRAPPHLGNLFQDIAPQRVAGSDAASNAAIGLKYHQGPQVTVLVSKNAGRYRIQSDKLEALWLILRELCSRLSRHYQNTGEQGDEAPFSIQYDEALPLSDFLELIDQHFNSRLVVRELVGELADRAQQFRSIQKRLLIRFKDRTPASLGQLDVLMEETYFQLVNLGNSIHQARGQQRQAAQALAGGVQLMVQLIALKHHLSPQEVNLLRSYITAEVHDEEDVGWEEITEVALADLLRTGLTRLAKEGPTSTAPWGPIKDTQKLKKHLSLVLERMAKGVRLAVGEKTAEVAEQQRVRAMDPAGRARQPLYREEG